MTPTAVIGLDDEDLVEYVRSHAAVLQTAVEAELFLTYTWKDQCNLAFEPATLAEIAGLGITLCITCVEDEPLR